VPHSFGAREKTRVPLVGAVGMSRFIGRGLDVDTIAGLDGDPRLSRAWTSLEGLSVGDAFGERFFGVPDELAAELIGHRGVPAPPWRFTDDTMMALSIVETLRIHGAIDPDHLARSFAQRHDPTRGYGAAMHGLLARFREGDPWSTAAPSLFDGEGTYGNGAAMRVAPVGAYFAEDLDAVVEHARRSAVVTHAHAEAVAGAIAVAVAAAWAWRLRDSGPLDCTAFLDLIRPYVPSGVVAEQIERARDLDRDAPVALAVAELGNGLGISAQDTVPFALWCAGHRLGEFEEALWLTVSGLGDRDTTCAIVGGIVAVATGPEAIPGDWRQAREPLTGWVLSSA
jgi:ADP-ribosylglycohydrolase